MDNSILRIESFSPVTIIVLMQKYEGDGRRGLEKFFNWSETAIRKNPQFTIQPE
jgi:hypothetical protein